MTRAELMERMSASEFREWMILEEIEPYGERGDWFRAAMYTCILANAYRGKDRMPFKIEDFLPENLFKDPNDNPAANGERMFNFFMMIKAHQDSILARQQREKEEQEATAARAAMVHANN